jgi:Carboxypeptidase regulatory-like domain
MGSMRMLRCAIGALTTLLLLNSIAWAQGTSSRLTGLVTDETGGVLPGAAVTATNEGTNIAYTAFTTDAGTYTFEALPIGTYTVSIELQGFKKFVGTQNPVRVGETTTLNAKLQAGGVAETITVTAAASTVQLSSSGNFGSVIDQQSIQSLPIIGGRGRNPLDLVLTQPGVVNGANTGGGIHVHGARDRSWNYTLDGIDTNESSAGGSNFSPLRANPDSLAEFKVLTSNTTAEFGRNSGGQVAMITRSGTNELHGTGFYFLRRPDLNANEWQNPVLGVPKRQEEQDMGGFSLGGPIRKNKTFFFANAQILRATRTTGLTRTVYTQQARQGLWRYVSGGRNQPFGVSGASVDANGNPLPGLAINTYNIAARDPQALGLDPTNQQIVNGMPLPNTFTVGDGLNLAGFSWSPEEQEKQHDIVFRIDHTFNESHAVFARVAWGRQDTLCDQVNGGDPRYPGGPCLVNTERDPLNQAYNWRWVPGGTMINELVVGTNSFTFDFVSPLGDPSKYSPIFADINLPEDYQWGNARGVKTLQIVDNFSWVRGAHALKFGTNMRFQRHKDERGSVGGVNVVPTYDFSTTVNSVDPTVFGLPSDMQVANDRPQLQRSINFLLGRVGNINQGFVQDGSAYGPGGTLFIFESRYPEVDLYAQDSWKIARNLTIDLGLRWELKYTPSNPDNRIRRPNQRVAVGEAPSSTLRWEEGDLYKSDLNNLAPSIGAAWDPTGSGKSSVRGNYRIAYDRINTFLFSSVIFQSIPGITASIANATFGQAGGRLRQGLPSLQPTASPDSFIQPPNNTNNLVRVVDPEFQSPRTQGWALSYQRELPGRMVFEATYIGRRADNLFGAYDVNQAELLDNGFLNGFNVVKGGGESALINQLLAPDSRRLATETGSQFMRRQFASQLTQNSVGAVAQDIARRVQGGQTIAQLSGLGPYFFYPYTQYLNGMQVIDSGDWSRYNAFELKLEKRSPNLTYLLAYTLAKSMDTRSYDPAFTVVSTGAVQSASSTPFDIENRELNYAPSDFDRRHVVNGAFVYSLPFGRDQKWGRDANAVVDAVIGGWQVAGILTVQSGRPFTVYAGSNTLSNVVQTPADCAGCSTSDGSVFADSTPPNFIFYFDQALRSQFSIPAAGAFGNTGRNFFYGDGGFQIDMSFTKRFRLFGSQSLDFRADVTNLTNTPTFGFPTTTITDGTFGRIRSTVASTSRKVQLGLKYDF